MGDYPPDNQLALRAATLDDLDDIATVAQQGFPDDPEFNYRFPHRHDYPDDNRKWILQEYREYLEQPDKYAVTIVTASDNNDKAIALSVWDISISKTHQGGDLGVPDNPLKEARRNDVNATHFRQFKLTMNEYFDTYFGKYGDGQIHLWLLATHPKFRRRGAGTRLCRWGLERAAQMASHTTVLASPMGMHLYGRLGFTNCGSFVIQAEGDDEKLVIWAMMIHAKRPEGCNPFGWVLRLLGYRRAPLLRN